MGPARVWHKDINVPGLAMSRSIGDLIAKNLGVISIPIVTTHNYRPDIDQFLVVGSDGLWDVMSNIEAVNFV